MYIVSNLERIPWPNLMNPFWWRQQYLAEQTVAGNISNRSGPVQNKIENISVLYQCWNLMKTNLSNKPFCSVEAVD